MLIATPFFATPIPDMTLGLSPVTGPAIRRQLLTDYSAIQMPKNQKPHAMKPGSHTGYTV
ncbi:hypothetical protein NCCNTM_09080 [Mycolicibacterium sp. NCC-Tsukiji]|nr:hypothetical protein NCCNTM_09080 [Mycolicibacterium sp. NCC-Tsukiji]